MEKIKEVVVQYLKDKSAWEALDELLVEELLFNIEIMSQAKSDLYDKTTGTYELVTNITRDPDKEPFYQKNRLLDTYNLAFKNVKDIYVKLGLTVQERIKLKLAMMEAGQDEFEEVFG